METSASFEARSTRHRPTRPSLSRCDADAFSLGEGSISGSDRYCEVFHESLRSSLEPASWEVRCPRGSTGRGQGRMAEHFYDPIVRRKLGTAGLPKGAATEPTGGERERAHASLERRQALAS